MGWLWAASSKEKPSTDALEPPNPPNPRSAPSEPVDPEIQKFYDLFKNDHASSSSYSSSAKQPSPTVASATSTASTAAAPSSSPSSSPSPSPSFFSLRKSSRSDPPPVIPPLSPMAESLLPTSMSCRQAFDLAWGCNNVAGQWNAVYRYGAMRSCSALWDDFWFCMRTKNHEGEAKEEMIRSHYRRRELEKYGSGKASSEDVWQSRDGKVESGSVFAEAVDDL